MKVRRRLGAYYRVKLEQANPHSLASTIGTSLSEVMEIPKLFNLVKMQGDQFRVTSDPECWKKDQLNPCAEKIPNFQVYVRLGPE